MSDIWNFIILVIIVGIPQIVIGAVISLPVLLPPVRRLCRRSATGRIAIICTLAFVSFIVSFGLCTKFSAEIDYIFSMPVYDLDSSYHPDPQADKNKPDVVNELWIRSLIPPPLRGFCYAHEATVCELANKITATPTHNNWMQYLITFGISFISVAASSGLAWLFTRQR